ncbi:hypothetical protein L3Q82_007610 [Scortum barcoo]|uniref:Uncharacterized protein n=1 Tax=Scortum barcoo TaxID=214431 RepID=A0ACB8WNS9_9TELE|nr:hypothetical protein L3Q82_007610 [Scortum barcoo]
MFVSWLHHRQSSVQRVVLVFNHKVAADDPSISLKMLTVALHPALCSPAPKSEEADNYNRPNVCVEREVTLVAQRQPCVQAFTRMVKVWKQDCVGQSWCMGYERRTAYYTAYRQVYRQDYQTVYKCCPGWSQLNGEAGCLYPVCSYGVCFNGGQCREGSTQLCDCPAGFNGPSCQYAALLCNYLKFNSGLSLDSNSPVACCNLPFVAPRLTSHRPHGYTQCILVRPCTYHSSISHTCDGEGDRLETTTSNFWIPAGLHVLSQVLTTPGSKLEKTSPNRS